jgi:hypothetical protein
MRVRLLAVLGALALTATVAVVPAAAEATPTASQPSVSALLAPLPIGLADHMDEMHQRHHGCGCGMDMGMGSPWGMGMGSPWGMGMGMGSPWSGSSWWGRPWWAGRSLWEITAASGGTWPWAPWYWTPQWWTMAAFSR